MQDNVRSLVGCVMALIVVCIGCVPAAALEDITGARHPDRWIGTVVARSLNVRSGPGEGYPIIGKLKRGEKITAVDEAGRWVRLESVGDDKAQMWAYRTFVDLPDDFMAPALGDVENAFVDWAAARGDLEEFSIDSSRRLSVVLAEPTSEAGAASIAREIGCEWRARMAIDESVTVTVWPDSGPLGGWIAQSTCP